jgi:ABC-type sugar transport system ATPase subunit
VALGYAQTRQVEDLIRRMAGRSIAVVIVTHNLPLCFQVADRIVVLNRGRKVADVRTTDTDNDSVVGWITGAKGPQEALRRVS